MSEVEIQSRQLEYMEAQLALSNAMRRLHDASPPTPPVETPSPAVEEEPDREMLKDVDDVLEEHWVACYCDLEHVAGSASTLSNLLKRKGYRIVRDDS